jgi:hypothetical protein
MTVQFRKGKICGGWKSCCLFMQPRVPEEPFESEFPRSRVQELVGMDYWISAHSAGGSSVVS